MSEADLTNREDPKLQADPVLKLSEGRATFRQKLFTAIAVGVVIVGTLYGIFYQHGGTQQSRMVSAVPGTVLPAK